MRPEAKHPEAGIRVAHAAAGDSSQGCAKCHGTPVTGNCASCHTTPRTQVGTIAFPHHDPASSGPAIKDCSFTLCHGGGAGDARFVKVTKGTHSYCAQCHKLTHS